MQTNERTGRSSATLLLLSAVLEVGTAGGFVASGAARHVVYRTNVDYLTDHVVIAQVYGSSHNANAIPALPFAAISV